MVDNKFTIKTIKGIFSKIPISIQKYREEKKEEKRLDNLQTRQEHKENVRYYNQDYINEAREHIKNKAKEIIDTPNLPLAMKLKALNEYHKDHRQPKINPSIQELSDKTYINKYRREKRFERMDMLKKVLSEHKENQLKEREDKINKVKERNEMLKMNSKANMILIQAKNELRKRGFNKK